jgi:hypothetical protein
MGNKKTKISPVTKLVFDDKMIVATNKHSYSRIIYNDLIKSYELALHKIHEDNNGDHGKYHDFSFVEELKNREEPYFLTIDKISELHKIVGDIVMNDISLSDKTNKILNYNYQKYKVNYSDKTDIIFNLCEMISVHITLIHK